MSSFIACKTGGQVLESSRALKVEGATFQNHFYGAGEYGRETELTVRFSSINEGVQPDSIFFRGHAAQLKKNTADLLFYTASIKVPSAEQKTMHLNPAMEMNNPVPDINSRFPFTLKNDEAVISFRENNNSKYIKITELKEIKPMAYPSGYNPGNKQ